MVCFRVVEVNGKELTVTCTENSIPFGVLGTTGNLVATFGHSLTCMFKYVISGNRMVLSGTDWPKFRSNYGKDIVAGGVVHIERLRDKQFSFEVEAR